MESTRIPVHDKKEEALIASSALPSDETVDMYRVLEVTQLAGELLLENGAEIFRVEETMQRIAAHFGVRNEEFFVLSNGIFMTGDDEKHSKVFARVKFIPMKGTQLYKVVMINQLSREIEEGKYRSIEEVAQKLEEIRTAKGKSNLAQIVASGAGAAAFCVLFGGTLIDAAAALIAGFLLYIFMLYIAYPRFSKIVCNLSGGAVATLVCLLLFSLGLGDGLHHMIIGSIIPLIPGVAFTNGIRDMADSDYLSGTVRLLDAILGFICIAVGVAFVFIIYRHLFGGILL